MKHFMIVATGLIAAALLGTTVGCNHGESTTVTGEGGKKLTLTAPANSSVTQGETATINVAITRDKFNDPVGLTFTGLPDGVSVMEHNMTIAKDAKSAKFTLKAAPEAKPVDNDIVTVAAAGGGMNTHETFKVTVKKASGSGTAAADHTGKFNLKTPADFTIPQGGTAIVNTEIVRDKYSDPVTLSFSGLPTGVTQMEKDWVIGKDVSTSQITLKAADNAQIVDNVPVTVTATGGGATQQQATFHLTVKKK